MQLNTDNGMISTFFFCTAPVYWIDHQTLYSGLYSVLYCLFFQLPKHPVKKTNSRKKTFKMTLLPGYQKNFHRTWTTFWNCYFPMSPHVRPYVSWLLGRSVFYNFPKRLISFLSLVFHAIFMQFSQDPMNTTQEICFD